MRTIPLVQLGVGGVGRALVRQVLAQRTALAGRYGFELTYWALADSAGALQTGGALDDEALGGALEAKAQGAPLAQSPGGRPLSDWRELLPPAPAIIIDVSASDGMEGALAEAVAQGHRVALANKRPLCADLASFRALTAAGRTRYEATVGAGLPVIATLQSMLDSGDAVGHIEAALSGTLGFLCSALDDDQPLSAALTTAYNNGWTEPDPRDDLSGKDVARKALILARTCGYEWSLDDVPSQPWYPTELAGLSVAEFMRQVGGIDENFRLRLVQTRAHSAVLRYVASVDARGARVGFRELPPDHAIATLRGTDNLITFTTARYNERPLVVRGPGAGVAVTAAAVLGDVVAHAQAI
jgi:homoserine dehydrogenase